MNIKIESNIRAVLSEFRDFSRESVPYAIKEAINDTMFLMRADVGNELKRVVDKPVPFTTLPSAWEIRKATKTILASAMAMRPMQASYMQYMVHGGTELPKGKAIPVPTSTGKMRAPHGGLKKTWKAAFAADKVFFSGAPRGPGGTTLPAGIYRRVGKRRWDKKQKKHVGGKLVLEVRWEESTRYRSRWDPDAYGARLFAAHFEMRFRARLQERIGMLPSPKT